MVNCPSRARRGLAAGLTAAITLAATAPLAGAAAANDPNSASNLGVSSVSTVAQATTTSKATKTSTGSTRTSERTSSKSKGATTGSSTASESVTTDKKQPGKSTESTESTEPTEKSEETSPEKSAEKTTAPAKTFAPLVAGAKTKWGQGVQTRMDEVTKKFDGQGGMLGMGILDRETGEFICNSHCDEAFSLASLMKVFVADVVAYTNYTRPEKGQIVAGEGDMPVSGNADAMARDDMIRYSNNEATDQLWENYGGVQIVSNVKERYGLSDKTVGSVAWGATTSSPADLVAYFDRMLDEDGGLTDVETRYLKQLLYSLPRYSYGDADQNFGLRKALPKETIGNKSGWYNEMHTTAGFLGDDARFAIAVLGRNLSGDDLTEAVSTVFPDGEVLPTDNAKTVHISEPLEEAEVDSGSSGMGPVLWALVAAVIGFGLGWLLRRVQTD